MATAGRVSGLVIQALRHIGKNNVNDSILKRLQQNISDQDKEKLLQDVRYAPTWIAADIRRILKQEGG
jgi:hypothetical protein